jgi:hypothetical protein
MKPLLYLATALLATLPALAQTAAPANPVADAAREIYARQSKYIVAAFDQMPADKYTYSPTPGQMSFAKLAIHITGANNHVCAMLTTLPAPPEPKLTPADSKDALIAAVKDSFAYCDKALPGLKDASLGDTINYFRNTKATRARALFELTNDLEDHYSQMAGYLRMNNLTPPSAAPAK